MYFILIFFIAIFFVFISYKQSKAIFSPIIVFNIWWLACIIIATINPYNLFQLVDKTYFDLSLGMFFFDVSSFLIISISQKKKLIRLSKSKNVKNHIENTKVNIKLFLKVQWILILIILPYAIKAISVFRTYGWAGMRDLNLVINDPIFHSTVEVQIYRNLLIIPCVISCTILACIFFASGKMKIQQMIPTFILIMFQVFITSGRLTEYRFIIFLVFAFTCCRYIVKNKENFKKNIIDVIKNNKRILIVLIIVIVILVLNITSVRSISNEGDFLSNNIKTIIIYLTGSLHYFSLTLSYPSIFGLNDPLLYGRGFIGGIYDTYTTFCSFFLHIKMVTANSSTFYIDSSNQIGNNIYFNAFPTMYYIFMRDFGQIGIIIETSIFSLICSKIFLWFDKNKSIMALSIYILFIYLIINSVLWWELMRLELWYAMLHLCWLIPLLRSKSQEESN